MASLCPALILSVNVIEMSTAVGFMLLTNSTSEFEGVDGERLNVVNPFESKNDSIILQDRQCSSPTGVVMMTLPLSRVDLL